MTNSELRDAAAKCRNVEVVGHMDGAPLIRGRHYGTMRPFDPTESHDDAALLLAEVERRGRQSAFVSALCREFPSDHYGAYWLIANATPEQKTRAAVEALSEGK